MNWETLIWSWVSKWTECLCWASNRISSINVESCNLQKQFIQCLSGFFSISDPWYRSQVLFSHSLARDISQADYIALIVSTTKMFFNVVLQILEVWKAQRTQVLICIFKLIKDSCSQKMSISSCSFVLCCCLLTYFHPEGKFNWNDHLINTRCLKKYFLAKKIIVK